MEHIGFDILLLAVVVLSSMLARSFAPKFPLSLIQIAVGSALAQIFNWRMRVAPEVFFPLFLAPLLFLDGWRIPRAGLFRDSKVITSLAMGLVLFTVFAAGYFIHWLIPTISVSFALVLASILSPTDTVAVLAIAPHAPIPRRLLLVLEGESLLNDASSLVCFRFAIAAALSGVFSLKSALLSFVWMVTGGALIGIATCVCANLTKDWVTRRHGEEVGVQILVSLIIPFSAYLLADAIGSSGILAAVSAGIMMGIEERADRASAITRIRRSAVWDTLQFAGNGAIFVLLGQQLPGIIFGASLAIRQSDRQNEWWLVLYVLSISAFLITLRWLWTSLTIRLTSFGDSSWSHECNAGDARLSAIAAFAGPRGAVTLAAAMTIPLFLDNGSPWPARDLAVFLAAGVIVVSMISTNAGLIYFTRPFKTSTARDRQEERALRSSSAHAALRAIDVLISQPNTGDPMEELYVEAGKRVAEHYRQLIDANEQCRGKTVQMKLACDIERSLRLVALSAQRKELYRISGLGQQNENLIRGLVYEIDLQESQLFSQKPD